MHNNKKFSQQDYDRCNAIGVAKAIELFRYLGYHAYQAPDRDKMAHYDVIVEIPNGAHVDCIKVECETRREHYDTLYNGGFEDVRFPKRKFYIDCDGPNEREDLPDLIVTMHVSTNDRRFIIMNQDAIRQGLSKKYKAWNKETRIEEWFVPISKEHCNRLQIDGDAVIDEGKVSDGCL